MTLPVKMCCLIVIGLTCIRVAVVVFVVIVFVVVDDIVDVFIIHNR